MRHLYIILSFIILTTLAGCFKDYEERYLFTDNRVEFQDAVINSSPLNLPALSEKSGVVRYRVNMTGTQRTTDLTLPFRVIPEQTTARLGIDFSLPKGSSYTIPANSSFGWVEIEILQNGSGKPKIQLELLPDEEQSIKVMDRNYHKIGFQALFPSTPPAEIELINDISIYSNITFGSASNPTYGNYIDARTGYSYITDGANNVQDKIDFVVLRSGAAGSEQNILLPSSGDMSAFAPAKHIVLGDPITGAAPWTIRNNGEIMRLHNATVEELDLFENAVTKTDLFSAYDYYFSIIKDRPGYSSSPHGPARRVRTVAVGDIVAFKSAVRDVVLLMKVEEVVDGSVGYIKGKVKSGGED